MSNRDRWIIYPLLFLALGVALRDKLFRQVQTEFLRCQTLVVGDQLLLAGDDNRPLVRLAAEPTSGGRMAGSVRVFDSGRNVLGQVGEVVRCRKLLVIDESGVARVWLDSVSTPGVSSPGASPTAVAPGGQTAPGTAAGRLSVHGGNGQPVVLLTAGRDGSHGEITTLSANGRGQMVLSSNDGGGVLKVLDAGQQLAIGVGHFERFSGLFAETAGGRIAGLLQPLVSREGGRPQTPQSVPGPPEPPAER